MNWDKLWTDNDYKGEVRKGALVPLPVGLRDGYKCPKCGSGNISGALIMSQVDEQDPNIVCLDCSYWWD